MRRSGLSALFLVACGASGAATMTAPPGSGPDGASPSDAEALDRGASAPTADAKASSTSDGTDSAPDSSPGATGGDGGALPYRVGAAKVDITGPFAGSSTGYNDPGVQMTGLAMRLYSRAFVIEDPNVAGSFVAIATADVLHSYESIKLGVVKRLAQDGYGAVLRDDNVLVAGTHTHSAPSNISWYSTYDTVNGVSGFDPLNYAIVAGGVAQSIEQAYAARKPASITLVQGALSGAAWNRAAPAYAADTDTADYATNVDETVTLLRVDALDGAPVGIIDWFGVHGTSLGITNRREHGDNKGWAAYQFEKTTGGGIVAAFAQALFGDVSPNRPDPSNPSGAFLRPSDGDGGVDPLENPILEGAPQLDEARELYQAAGAPLPVGLDERYAYRDFNAIAVSDATIGPHRMPWDMGPVQYPLGVPIPDGGTQATTTCTGVVGGGILSGDPEGAPVSISPEGTIRNTYVMNGGTWVFQKYNLTQLGPVLLVLGAGAELLLASDQYDVCHKEKYALIGVGAGNPPSVPTILPLQILRIGTFALAAAPFELTTMTGRRIRKELEKTLGPAGVQTVVVVGMANGYAQYMATREEYSTQYYEGTSTLFGPWASAATLQEFARLAADLAAGHRSDPGPAPLDLSANQTSLTPIAANGVPVDAPGPGFGTVLTDATATYSAAHDTVTVTFQGAHPRSVQELQVNGMLSRYQPVAPYSYFEIDVLTAGAWAPVATDGDPYTAFDWTDTSSLGQATSTVTVTWLLRGSPPGTYRIVYHGIAKTAASSYQAFSSTSRAFAVQ
jgi:neutral ceramidase